MKLVSVCAVAIAVLGCGASPKRAELVLDEVRGYNDGVRWQKTPQAALRIPPREREEFFDERDELADELRIADYEIIRVRQPGRGERAVIQVKWTWHLDSKGIVHTTTSQQEWEMHGKRWLMVAEHRVRGEPMPGVPEDDGNNSSHPDQ